MAPTTLLVVGKINSPNFQKARALAEAVNGAKVSATVEVMLPADYDRYLTKTKLEYGSTAWAHTASVMVTSDSGYVGDDEALIATSAINWMAPFTPFPPLPLYFLSLLMFLPH